MPQKTQDLASQYQNKRKILDMKDQELDKTKESSGFKSFLNSFLADILLFTAALVTMIITLVIEYIMYRQSKLKVLVTNIAMQCIKGVEATDMSDILCTCKTHGTSWVCYNNYFRHALFRY